MPDASAKYRAGDVVLVRARVVAAHDGQDSLVVKISESPRYGGPGHRIDVLSMDTVHSIELDPPTDPRLVPPLR